MKMFVYLIFFLRINKMREAGLLTHWTKQWTPRALNCTGLKPVTNAKVVDLTDFQGALYVLGGGVLVGIIALLLELCAHCNRKQKHILPQRNQSDDNNLIGGSTGAAPTEMTGCESPAPVSNGHKAVVTVEVSDT